MSLDSLFSRRDQIRKPPLRKALPWVLGAGVIATGIAALILFVGNTGKSTVTPLSNEPAVDVSRVPKTVKLEPAARRVAKQFILTAVARRNLRAAYPLVGPGLKQGQTLKEWMTGNIAVIPYPVDQLDFAPMKVDFSYANTAQIEIALLPKASAKIRPQLFIADLKKINGRWVVDGWVPRSSPPVPNGSSKAEG
jgi:hypothetical protein